MNFHEIFPMNIGKSIHTFTEKLWKTSRSLTGEVVREFLEQIWKRVPLLEMKSVPSATVIFDWVVPKERNFNKAVRVTSEGKKKFCFDQNNLDLLGCCITQEHMSLNKLQRHFYYLHEQPDAIPHIESDEFDYTVGMLKGALAKGKTS